MRIRYLAPIIVATVISACAESISDDDVHAGRIGLSANVDNGTPTRANSNGFEDGDAIGVYVVDYEGNDPGTLKNDGNRGDNVRFTLDTAAQRWVPDYDIYWKNKHTNIDVYGYYYPYGNPTDVNSYMFEVQRDQSTTSAVNGMGGYEASDFLWGKVVDVAPTTQLIRLPMRHRLACVQVRLTEGNGFSDGEWASTEKSVLVTNITRNASINLTDGSVNADNNHETTATIPLKNEEYWRAIVVPQTVAGGVTMFTITVDGKPFKFSRQDGFTFKSGELSHFTIRVDKNKETGDYALSLVSESITPWNEDPRSLDVSAKEYKIVKATEKHLKDSIDAAHLKASDIKNLKITGTLDSLDFIYIRNNMTSLRNLNLKEVSLHTVDSRWPEYYDRIPGEALSGMKTLIHVILPDNVKVINAFAFDFCTSLSGSLIIPDGCRVIGAEAFCYCAMLNGTLYLPASLEAIGSRAFEGCDFDSELSIPENIKEIGFRTFAGNAHLHGRLILPRHLITINDGAFYGCSGFKGDLVIPQTVKTIGANAFEGCDFDGTLTLTDGITVIGESAFANNASLKGTINLPGKLYTVEPNTFNGCSGIENVIIPKNVESIGGGAFAGCTDLKSIVCHNTFPPSLGKGAFEGVDKETTTVSVPESSIDLYKEATGWKDFANIVAIK